MTTAHQTPERMSAERFAWFKRLDLLPPNRLSLESVHELFAEVERARSAESAQALELERLREWAEIGRALGDARIRAGTLFADVHEARADMEACAKRARDLLTRECATQTTEGK